MKKSIILILILGVLGLVVGYLIFGKLGGDYVSLKTIFGSTSKAGAFFKDIAGVTKIKQNILISGGVGAILGLLISFRKAK